MFEKFRKIFSSNKNQNTDNHKRRVLIVDDSPADRKLIETIVSKQGYGTLTAENGESGLKVARAEKPDLILLDCEMPIMGGKEMCKRLKDESETENIPVLFLTGLDTPQNVVDCFEADAENYLSKPVNSKILLSQIKVILEEQPS